MLSDKRILVTGVLTRHSIAFEIAAAAQRRGATVLLTSFGRARSLTERAARALPDPPEVLDLDVTEDAAYERLHAAVAERWDRLDGIVHAVAAAPADALDGGFLDAPAASATSAFATSAFSLKALTVALLPLFDEHGGAVVGLDFDASRAWPYYDWMGVAKAALESVNRYLARALGPRGVRVNLISSGPLQTAAASAFSHFDEVTRSWIEHAPLSWDAHDASVVADPACFLLSEQARGITGEILHVDGGIHAIAWL